MIHFGDPECRITVMGKEVLLDGKHFADGATPEIAEALAISLTYIGTPYRAVPPKMQDKLERVFS